ncbi:MAG: carboxyl transferase domain-containing protein [Oscillospiraceae bacterium]
MTNAKHGKEILAKFFDEGAFTTYFSEADSAVVAAFGSANGEPVYALCQNGNAMSVKDNQNAVKFIKMAAKTGNPIVTFYNSVGAKLEEGLDALKANANLTAAVSEISGVVPQIAVVTGVCGASSALAAASADICIMSKTAEMFLTPPYTSNAQGDKLAGAGSAEFAAKAGVVHIVVDTAEEAAAKAAVLVGILPSNNLSSPALFNAQASASKINLAKYDALQACESIADQDSLTVISTYCGKEVVTALGAVSVNVVGFVATNGENDTMCKSCVAKAARFVRFCDAFSIPVITLINTDGFKKSSTGDMAGGIREAARLAGTYADATTAKLAVFTGKAVSTAYTAFANADVCIALQGCVIAPIDPKTAVTVLYKDEIANGENIVSDTDKLADKYANEKCSAAAAVEAGLADISANADTLRACVVSALDMLSTKRTQRLPKKHGNMAL